MAKRFEGKRAWITGGGSGIGRALALELARRGADVAVSGRREDKIGAVADEIESLGRRGRAIRCDVTDESSIESAVDQVVAELGGLDLVVANAGFAVAGKIANIDGETWRRQLDVNVVGAALTVRHALPHLRDSRGRIGLVGSVAAFLPLAGNGAYVASKAALRAVGATLSVELAKTGVTCTTIHPGFVESEIAQVDNAGQHDPSKSDGRPKQLLWTAEAAAKVMANALHSRKREYVFTAHGKVGAWLGQHMPGFAVFAQSRGQKKR